jgi:uncharacterized protein YyaL (SSP411 family)
MKTTRYLAMLAGLCAVLMVPGPRGAQASALDLRNEMADSDSPYLILHAKDPVKWQTWSKETLALARKSRRLLYVSDGYYACLWCHVMQRESYRNLRIAAYLNAHFIPVKVDRELNEGLDDALQDFAAAVIRQGGWPLNAFVTPEGYPLTVVLYQPPADFLETLMRVEASWTADAAKLSALAKAAVPEVPQVTEKPYGAGEKQALVDAFIKQSMAEADTLEGGFGEAAKFPHVPQLRLLLEWQSKMPDQQLAKWLRLTLDAMAGRGMRDHVNGGFFRYTTDPGWTVPHFEKMLYDNAQLSMLYLRAAQVMKDPEYGAVARSTLDFMLAFLHDQESGGFYSSISAVDESGKDGAFYLWSREEIRTALPPEEFALARRIWKLDQPSPFNSGDYLPANYVQPDVAEQKLLRDAYARLASKRDGNDLPRDRKMLTGLNGLTLSAFSMASSYDPRYRQAAQQLARFMQSQWRNGLLDKGRFGNRTLQDGELEDYAYGAAGLLDYAEAFSDKPARQLAAQWAAQAWKLFAGSKGWKSERVSLLKSMQSQAILEDGATPSPSAALIAVSLKLGKDGSGLYKFAGKALNWRDREFSLDPFAYPTQLGLIRDGMNGT